MERGYLINGKRVSRAEFLRLPNRNGSGLPYFHVENVRVVSNSMPFLTDAQLRDPSIPKALNYTKDPDTGLNHATFSSKRERLESAKRCGYVVD